MTAARKSFDLNPQLEKLMSTNSTITARFRDGKDYSIYCHWDGHIDTAGRTLFKHYQSQDKIEELLNLGGLSELKDSPLTCIAYGRDRGEKGMEKKEIDAVFLYEKDAQEYNYYWDGEKWFCKELGGNELTEENTK